MSVFEPLIGQTLLEVAPVPGNTGLRFSNAGFGLYAPFTGTPLQELVGQSVTQVHFEEFKYLEVVFSRGVIWLDLSPEAQLGPEAFCVTFEGRYCVSG